MAAAKIHDCDGSSVATYLTPLFTTNSGKEMIILKSFKCTSGIHTKVATSVFSTPPIDESNQSVGCFTPKDRSLSYAQAWDSLLGCGPSADGLGKTAQLHNLGKNMLV
jgi:hypothetical protein